MNSLQATICARSMTRRPGSRWTSEIDCRFMIHGIRCRLRWIWCIWTRVLTGAETISNWNGEVSWNWWFKFERTAVWLTRGAINSILGTHGRVCSKTSTGLDSCSILCCGRGYNTKKIVVKERCNCKFHWCCQVKCDVCIKTIEEYTCK